MITLFGIGEAEYVDDIPSATNELHGAFVQSTQANAKIDSINPEAALKVPGVIDFFSAEDVPGYNSFVSRSSGDDKVCKIQ